jgi:hypothetical protein
MRVALRKDHDVPGDQMHRRLTIQFDEAFAFGDQVKNHYTLCAGLEDRYQGIRAWRLIAPGGSEPGLDEDRTDQAHDAERLR